MFDIIPCPSKIQKKAGSVTLKGTVTVSCSERYEDIAEMFVSRLHRSIPSVNITENGDIRVEFNVVTGYGQEEYSIDIDSCRIEIRASKRAGFVYAYYTLYQLLELHKFHSDGISVSCCYISDKPRFRWRSLMLDESRHFFGKEEILRLLEIMALHKLNALCWHLSDDQGYRIESKAFPLLHEVGAKRFDTQIGGTKSSHFRGIGHEGYYKQSEIKEIVEKAHSLNILIVPEISLPTHISAMAAAYPYITCGQENIPVATSFGPKNLMLCAGSEKTFSFVTALLDEICDIFPSPYISVSAKDLHAENWLSCEKCREYMAEKSMFDPKELQADFLSRVSDHLMKRGRRMMCVNSAMTDGMSADIIGNYSSEEPDVSVPEQLRWGRNYIISRPDFLEFDRPYCKMPLKKTYSFDPDNELKGCRYLRGKVMGIEAKLWTEWIYDREKLDLCLHPRMAALAEAGWSEPGNKSFKSFRERLPHYTEILEESDINYAKNKICMSRNIISRYRKLYYYTIMDQYMEVRENRT